MLKLVRLELKKNDIKGFINSALILDLVLCLLFIIAYIITSKTGDKSFYSNFDLVTGTAVKSVFVIFAGVMISKFVVSEYTEKTINVLFMYPVKREKFIISKLFIICAFTFIAMIISNLLIHAVIYLVNSFAGYINFKITLVSVLKYAGDMITEAFLFSLISLFPVFVGMKRKTVSSAIVTSIILSSFLNGSIDKITIGSIKIVAVIFALIGIFFSYLSVINIEKEDVI